MSEESRYFELAKSLEKHYPGLSFRDHCYWRIALDNTLGDRWDKVIRRPAYKNLDTKQLQKVNELLAKYLDDKDLLIAHNKNSLHYRGKLNK